MIERFTEIINQNLPAMVGEELREVLGEYEHLKRVVSKYKEDEKLIIKRVEELETENRELRNLNRDLMENSSEVDAMKVSFSEALRDIKIEKLTHELKCSRESNKGVMDLATIVFGNKRYVRNETTRTDTPIYSEPGDTYSIGTNTVVEEKSIEVQEI